MLTAEIRSRFIDYFKKNGHTPIESSGLVPHNDPSLLFTNAGMVQFKDVFLGKDKRSYSRAVSSQKCMRAGGKHNDLERVGFTARHHTFFEMLGNFSFGDYFKKEAIHYAWDFVTNDLKLPKDQLYVSVFENDNEAAEIWERQEKIPFERISKFSEEANFWSMADTGPCGPCSEIFIDRGKKYSCGKPTCAMGCDCDRFMEIWNLVFMQFERDASGKLLPLPKPSVDTGAGLERLSAVLQKVDSNYEIDIFKNIILNIEKLGKIKYDTKKESAFSFRVIADHSRAATFLISDGVLASNEGRGYVLRRILRRAIRHGQKIGFEEPFLYKTAPFVIEQMIDAYPDLKGKQAFIEKAIFAEEEQFLKTLERGLLLLDEEIAKLGSKTLPGSVAFKLYDTFGFPLDLTQVICHEKGISLDEQGFVQSMNLQKTQSRKNWKGSGDEEVTPIYLTLASQLKAEGKLPKFVGYEQTQKESLCTAILVSTENGLKSVKSYSAQACEGENILAIFAETPFYGESGGQVGDRGYITGEFTGEVLDVQKPVPDLIVAHIQPKKGTLKVGHSYLQETDKALRALTARNHTATHLLHFALRETLGNHVKQAGSLVSPDLLRFDFTHFQSLTTAEIKKIEDLINEKIWQNDSVEKKEMSKEKAIGLGAIAFFGEKYGEKVRVIKVGDYSTELCGGTHVDSSSDIHFLKIISETGIAAGVRRIVAYTSKVAFQYFRSQAEGIQKIQDQLKVTNFDEALVRLEKMSQTEKELRKTIERFQSKSANEETDVLLKEALEFKEICLVAGVCPSDFQGLKSLRECSERIIQKRPNAVVVLGMEESEKVSLLVAVGPKALGHFKANELIQSFLPLIDGKGGGKPELAQAGGAKKSGLEAVILLARKMIQEMSS